jgi:hypothetical protein
MEMVMEACQALHHLQIAVSMQASKTAPPKLPADSVTWAMPQMLLQTTCLILLPMLKCMHSPCSRLQRHLSLVVDNFNPIAQAQMTDAKDPFKMRYSYYG